MVHQPLMFLLYCLSISLGACQTGPDPGNCTEPNSSSIKCCPGYFLSENKCNECEPGYFGTNCSRICPSGHFGRRCLERCNCSRDMYCEPVRGCLCNTTSGNCTDQAADEDEEIIKSVVVPLLIPVIACLVFGTVCIRNRHSQILYRRKDFTVSNHRSETEELNPNDEIYDNLNLSVQHSNHSIYHTGSMSVTGDPASGNDVPLQQSQSEESIKNTWRSHDCDFRRHDEKLSSSLVDEPHVETVNDKTTDWQANIYSTPCKRVKKKPLSGISEQGQQKNGNETLIFEYPNSIIDRVVLEPRSQTKLCLPKWTQDEEIYANDKVIAFTKNSIKTDSPLESDESEECYTSVDKES